MNIGSEQKILYTVQTAHCAKETRGDATECVSAAVVRTRTTAPSRKEPNAMKVDEEAYKEIHETPGGRSKFYSATSRRQTSGLIVQTCALTK